MSEKLKLRSSFAVSLGLINAGMAFSQKPYTSHPNFIVILTDDQGYSDLSCYGANHVKTPNIDRMADEGVRLTSFYVAAPLSTPSRAALLTGSYPRRIGLATGSRYSVLLSDDIFGLNPDEITIAESMSFS